MRKYKKSFLKHTSTNAPHLTIGISVLAEASLFLSDPVVTPGMSTGEASKRGWIAPASFSRCATKSGKAWVHVKEWGEDEDERKDVELYKKKGRNNLNLILVEIQ